MHAMHLWSWCIKFLEVIFCFKSGNFNLQDERREGHLKGLNLEYLEAVVTAATVAREISDKFNISIQQFYTNWKVMERFQWLENRDLTTCLKRIANMLIVGSHCLHDNFVPFWTGMMRNGSFTIMFSAVFSGSVKETELLGPER